MSALLSNAITVGLLSGVWAYISTKLGIITWVGFIGCTSYYAAIGQNKKLKDSLISNIVGIVIGMMIIYGSRFLGDNILGVVVMTTVFSFLMVAQGKLKSLSFIPGTFLGCCCVFGTNGNWQDTVIAIICGGIFVGYISHITGNWLYEFCKK